MISMTEPIIHGVIPHEHDTQRADYLYRLSLKCLI